MEGYYPYIFDLFILVVLVICVIYGSKKGFLTMLTAFIGRIAAFVLALLICTAASSWVYDSFISKSVNESISSNLEELFLEENDTSVTKLVEKSTEDMPDFIHKTAMSYADKLTVNGGDVDKIAQTVEDEIVSPIIISALNIVIFIILLTFFMIVVKCLSKVFKGVNDIPLIGELNKLLGALIGVLNALIIVVVSAFVLKGAVLMLGNESKILNDDTINKSIVYSYVYSVPSFDKGE